ncbi:MAG TPA: hypothetical protein VK469_13650 [Candidatus Kapabacteria bacterium]|nr:hypothetical protein [Candidatus Kapabacteria bacterium]
MNNPDLIPMVGSVFIVGMIIWGILEWRRSKHKYELQNKLLEKFSAVPELNDFLKSQGGNKFLDFLTVGGIGPKEKLLASISKGVIFSILGLAFLFIGPFLGGEAAEIKGVQALGVVSMAIGIGFLVSTFISYKLSKKWGIIGTE